MAERDVPVGGRNFRVSVVLGGPRGGSLRHREVTLSQVVMPSLRLDARPRDERDPIDPGAPDASSNLLLRRAHTGSSELWDYWRAERDRERRQVREVAVELLDGAGRPVTSWHFSGCHVVALHYSPLDAADSGLLTETLEVSFKRVEQVPVGPR